VTPDVILISSNPNAAEWMPGVRVVPDASRKQGSLVGIHTALSYARQPILLVAWDMPFISRELLELLRDRSARSKYATVPVGPAGLEPFCAVYTPACLPWIESGLSEDDLRLSHMFERLPEYERVEPSDVAAVGDPTRLFFNVNDANDLAAAERMAARS
jgi:molybdopterin-guanine dinucleotide biosynthesis protein A